MFDQYIFFSVLYLIILNTLTFISFVLLGSHIIVHKSSTELILSLSLSKRVMNG